MNGINLHLFLDCLLFNFLRWIFCIFTYKSVLGLSVGSIKQNILNLPKVTDLSAIWVESDKNELFKKVD